MVNNYIPDDISLSWGFDQVHIPIPESAIITHYMFQDICCHWN